MTKSKSAQGSQKGKLPKSKPVKKAKSSQSSKVESKKSSKTTMENSYTKEIKMFKSMPDYFQMNKKYANL